MLFAPGLTEAVRERHSWKPRKCVLAESVAHGLSSRFCDFAEMQTLWWQDGLHRVLAENLPSLHVFSQWHSGVWKAIAALAGHLSGQPHGPATLKSACPVHWLLQRKRYSSSQSLVPPPLWAFWHREDVSLHLGGSRSQSRLAGVFYQFYHPSGSLINMEMSEKNSSRLQ